MTAGFYDWIRASFEKGHVTKNGEFIACDFDYKAMSAREFQDCHIAEVTIPALDGSSKEPAYMTIKLDPERIRYLPGKDSQLQAQRGTATKKWLTSNFRLELGDLPCNRVSKIDSFTWKQAVIKDEVGEFREATKHPAKVEVPNLKITFSMADIEAWQKWHKDFVIDGKCADEDELSGSITFLGPDLKDELASIELIHVGLISLETTGQEANREEVARATAEVYIEEMRFTYQDGANGQ